MFASIQISLAPSRSLKFIAGSSVFPVGKSNKKSRRRDALPAHAGANAPSHHKEDFQGICHHISRSKGKMSEAQPGHLKHRLHAGWGSHLICRCFTNRQRSFLKKCVRHNLDQFGSTELPHQISRQTFPWTIYVFIWGAAGAAAQNCNDVLGLFLADKNNENQGSWCPSRTILCQ